MLHSWQVGILQLLVKKKSALKLLYGTMDSLNSVIKYIYKKIVQESNNL